MMPELFCKVIAVIKAAAFSNFLHRSCGFCKQFLRQFKTLTQNIIYYGNVKLSFKFTGQIEFTDIKPFRQLVKGYFFSKILIKIVSDLLKILAVFYFYSPLQSIDLT